MEEEKDVYNLPIAAFTFGTNGQALPYNSNSDISKEKSNKNKNSKKNNNNSTESKDSRESYNNSIDDSENRFSFKNILKKENNNEIDLNKNLNININNNNFNNNNFVFIDKEDNNSSYLKTILYSVSYMKLLNEYFLNDLQLNNRKHITNKEKLLIIIKDILLKIDIIRNKDKNLNNSIHINNIINIEQLKENLSNLFKDKKKFLKNSPDNPIDFLYVIINLLHSLKAKMKQNQIPNNLVCENCFSHKYLWIKMLKIYECECKGQSKKILNRNNFFIDIAINIIINNYSKSNLYEMNQQLFSYYKQIISKININMDCPKLGNECKINKVHYKYILKNFPSYLIINLDNDYFKNNELFYSLKDILKCFVLIPHILNIGSLFNIDNKANKNYYELIGFIFIKISKVYTCMFRQNDLFYYYDDNLFLTFNNYYDIIIFSLKNGLIPISIFYQNIDLNNNKNDINTNTIKFNSNYELTRELILKLEKYIKNTDSLTKNVKNKIRTSENIISDEYTINYSIGSQYNNSSRYSGSINSYNSYQKNEYLCNHCERINKIEKKICFFCGYDNRPFLSNITKNSKNSKVHNPSNKSKNSTKKMISMAQGSEKKQNNELGEIEDEYKNIDPHVLKYFDMPRPYIPPPQKKDEKIISIKQSPKLNKKNKIPHSNNYFLKDKNIKNNKINNQNEIINLNNSPYIFNNSESNTIENNLLNKMNKNTNLKRKINITHKKRNSNSDNLINNNYYSQINKNNNQLNINLKINNNNNYNIFDFGNKKNIINLREYSGYGMEENINFGDKKLLKKINLIKTKKINNININNNSTNNIAKKNNLRNIYNISKSNNDLNNMDLETYLPNNINKKWICLNCKNENNNNLKKCLICKMERNIDKNNKFENYFNNNNININKILNEAKNK